MWRVVGVVLGFGEVCAGVGAPTAFGTASSAPAIARLLAMPSPLVVDGAVVDAAALAAARPDRGGPSVWSR